MTWRRTSTYHAQMRSGAEQWVATFPSDIDPRERELTGRSVGIVGIVGIGQVGRRLAELLHPFHVSLHVVDPYVPEPVVASFGARRCGMDEMIAACDVVVLCAAANEGTAKLFDARRIAALRCNAVFINVARAALVGTDALIARLRQGDLIAALDVFDKEPLPPESELRGLENAFLTPHRAGGVLASVVRTVEWLADDYERFLAGQPRRYAVGEAMLPAMHG